MKQLKHYLSVYQMDRLLEKAIKDTLSLDKRVGFSLLSLCLTILVYLPLALLIANLSIFVVIHVVLIVVSSLLLMVLPQVYLYFYYHVMKYFENEATFDKINRLILINGLPASILISIGIGFALYRFGGLL